MEKCKDSKKGYITIALAILLCAAPGLSVGQGITDQDLYTEILYLQGLELGSGGRALALGGAYRALSDDFSGLYWNPAGLASVRRIELSLGISQSTMRDKAQGLPSPISNDLSRTRLNETGVVFPFPTYRGSLVFALGYHQVHGFDYFGTFRSDYSAGSYFHGDELVSGRLGLWSLGVAVDLSPAVSVGLSLRLWKGYKDHSWTSYMFENALNDSSHDFTIDDDFSGFNISTGVLLKPIPALRIGATLETPLKLSADESFNELFAWRNDGEVGDSVFSAGYSYHVSRPFRFGIGAAVLIKRLGISADALLTDWSQISFTDEPPALYRDEANREITRRLKATADLHAGLEYWLPFLEGRLQAGYAYLPSPFKNGVVVGNKHVISGGAGVLVDPSLYIQTSIAWATWERSIGGWDEDLRLANFLVTISYRF